MHRSVLHDSVFMTLAVEIVAGVAEAALKISGQRPEVNAYSYKSSQSSTSPGVHFDQRRESL
ncbi:hypothetical protein GF407_14225 [candidate division KSB1 bacterium]|nr:hypothetical protein [candidate division KSB1 bacterium]